MPIEQHGVASHQSIRLHMIQSYPQEQSEGN